MTTTNLTLYGENSRQIKPAVVNLFQANNNVDRLEFQMTNYNQGNVDLSKLDPYAICYGSGFVDGLDEIKLTSEVTADGILRIYWDLTLMTLSESQTITYQLTFKGVEGEVWTSYKGILFCNESLTADEEIVAKYPTILKQMEGRIETKTDEAIEGVVEEITNSVSTEVTNAVTQINQIAGDFDASVVYIPYGEKIPVENRVSNRLYYQYMNAEHSKGRFEDSNGTILIVDESGAATYAPIGAIIPVNTSSNFVPEGCLPCNGAEYSKAMFKDLWNNWLTSEDFEVHEEGWQNPITVGSNNLRSAIYANDKYVVVGDNGTISTSNDGLTWNSQTVGTHGWNSITYGEGKFVVVNSYCEITTSTDGVNWTDVITIDNNDDYLYSVAYGNGKFVAVGAYGCVVTSVDGVNWGTPMYMADDLWNAVTYGNGKFVAIGDFTAATSTDGINWSEPVTLETKYHYSVTYGDGKFVAGGSYGNIMTSEDGLNWTKCDVVADVTWTSVTYAKDKFVAVGSQGYITSSTDGITWTEPVVMGSNAWASVTCGSDKLIVVGYSGTMVYNKFEIEYNTRLNTCSYVEYLEALAAYGQCSKFAVDVDNETFKVPTVNDSDSELIHFVVVANGQINESMMDWSEWVTSLRGKANTDLSNLTEVGEKHFLNKQQITNCITEIPQRIKLDVVDNGTNVTLTLKAGSIIRKPDGGKNTEITITQDIVRTENSSTWTQEGDWYLWTNGVSYVDVAWMTNCSSGSSPVHTLTGALWYDTTNKIIKRYNGSAWEATADGGYDICYPLGIMSIKNGRCYLKETFNGFGCIGGMYWTEKAVAGLAPWSRNEDGSLKSYEITTTQFELKEITFDKNLLNGFHLRYDGLYQGRTDFWQEGNVARVPFQAYGHVYDPDKNKMYFGDSNTTSWVEDAVPVIPHVCTGFVDSNGQLTMFKINKRPFRAVDYDEAVKKHELEEVVVVTETYQNGTSWYRVWSDGWCEQGGTATGNITVSLLKAYKNTNYCVLATHNVANSYGAAITSKTTTSFVIAQVSDTRTSDWKACGYIS